MKRRGFLQALAGLVAAVMSPKLPALELRQAAIATSVVAAEQIYVGDLVVLVDGMIRRATYPELASELLMVCPRNVRQGDHISLGDVISTKLPESVFDAQYRHVNYGYAMVREGDRIRIKPVGG